MNKEDLPEELPMMRSTRSEYVELALAMGLAPCANHLLMNNGTKVGWRSKKYSYISPVAYKVATGKYPRGYRP